MAIVVQDRHLKISRIFNRRRYTIRLAARISTILFVGAFLSYLLLSRAADDAATEMGTDIAFSGSEAERNRSPDATSTRERKFMETFASAFSNISLCPEVPATISTSPLNVNLSSIMDADPNSIDFDIDRRAINDSGSIRYGGWWQPIACVARHTTAIIIPYRDREAHLKILLLRLHQVLRNQMISYRIFVVEQNDKGLFNKGALFNAAFLYIRDYHGAYLSECVVLHDVDLIPEDERNMYTCPDPNSLSVRHMSLGVDKLQYKLPYPELVGGVLALSPEIYFRVNGYSNLYRGWGGEDDDMYERLVAEGVGILRPPEAIGRYKMLPHPSRPAALNRWRLLRYTKRRYKTDGLSRMVLGVSYNIVSIIEKPTYTHIVVDLKNFGNSKLGAGYFWCLLLIIFWCYVTFIIFR